MKLEWKPLPVADRWCVHAYYSLRPYAPDGSGRILVGAGNLESGMGEVVVLSAEGAVLDRFGSVPLHKGFYHTGLWQTWSPDSKAVYFQSGSLSEPKITRHDLETGEEITISGDMEGSPPDGEPIVSGKMGMLYAAGYGGGGYQPDQAPHPFQNREDHGLFEYTLNPVSARLRCSVAEILEKHPRRDWLLSVDREIAGRLGPGEASTLMAYCVRWSPDGSRCLFYFGNHCVDRSRGEPRIAFVMTTNRAMDEFHVAVDLSGRGGDHWSWQPNGTSLVGNGPDPEGEKTCVAEVDFDGANYKRIITRPGGGHPSVCPTNPDLVVTDAKTPTGGVIQFYSRESGNEIAHIDLPKWVGEQPEPGRNPTWVCHHAVFDKSGTRVLFNHMPGRNAAVGEIRIS